MIPVLYDAFEKDFTTNGIGLLTDAVSCVVTEERNGTYELTLTYPEKGHLAKYITRDAIIKAKANDEDEPQLFRIYKAGKAVGSNTTWNAEHISYEMNGNPVEKFTVSGVNAQRAMQELLDAAALPHSFTASSDITTTNSTSIDGVVSARNALGGTTGSILDVWGGEYHFNNFRIELLKARGADNGVTIEYGKNLISAKQEENIADVVTAIFPWAKYKAEGAEEETYISLPEKTLIHENASAYANIKCEIVDFSGEWESGTVITTDMLREKATEYLNKLSTEPKISITLSFASLKKTKDYKNMKALESVKLCDTVTVKIEKLGINVTAKITKVKYDSIKERYDSAEIGDTRTNLTKSMTAAQKEIQELVVKNQTRAEQIKAQIEQTIKDVTAAITGNSGGYVVLHPEKNPQEIFIMDTPDTATAKNVWRWNLAGLGHSSTGINGTFTTAITADGQIVADFITAGELTGAILKAGTVYAEALDVEYRNSVTKYADDAAAAMKAVAIQETISLIETTAEEIKLICKTIEEYNMHNYVVGGDFADGFTEEWYTNNSTDNYVVTDETLGKCVRILKSSSTSSYIRCKLGVLPAGTYRVRYKAATAPGYESTARVQCTMVSISTTPAGLLKSTEFTTVEREVTLSASTSTRYIYFYATVQGATVYIKDVEVLGQMRIYTEAQLKVNADAIEAEVTRAKGIEEELRASIKVNADNITSKVEKGDMGSYISQYYNNVIVAFNNNSKYVQITAGQIAIYNNGVTDSKKRAVFDESGNHFYRDGYYVGKIGTNQWSSNNAHKGLVFDLEYTGKYMAWAQEKTEGVSTYTTILCYSRANSIHTEEGLHLGCNLYANGWDIDGADLRDSRANGYTVSNNKRVPIITSITSNGDGTISWTYSSFTVRNGMITSVPDSSTSI